METYTGVADANGDFVVSFGSASYTSGEKVTITAEKDSAIKSIEIYAPSEVVTNEAPFTLSNPVATGYKDCFIDFAGELPSGAFATTFFSTVENLALQRVTSINGEVFRGWSGLKKVSLPSTLTALNGVSIFLGCNINELTIPTSVTSIGALLMLYNQSGGATAVFNNVKRLHFLANVSTIATNIFKQNSATWSSLQELTIGPSITSIPNYTFQRCPNLRQITMLRATPPTIGASTFTHGTDGNPDTNVGIHPDCIIKVPAASVAAYQAAPNWSAFASRIQAI